TAAPLPARLLALAVTARRLIRISRVNGIACIRSLAGINSIVDIRSVNGVDRPGRVDVRARQVVREQFRFVGHIGRPRALARLDLGIRQRPARRGPTRLAPPAPRWTLTAITAITAFAAFAAFTAFTAPASLA